MLAFEQLAAKAAAVNRQTYEAHWNAAAALLVP